MEKKRMRHEENGSTTSRRGLLTGVARLGLGTLGAGVLTGCGGGGNNSFSATRGYGAGSGGDGYGSSQRDTDILNAAKIAEALAVTMYTEIIQRAGFVTRLSGSNRDYFATVRDGEMAHYLLMQQATGGAPTPATTFFFPAGMFDSPKVTLDTITTLEDAFIAAYLIGVRDFSTSALRVTAARIMGVESNHRTLARIIAGNVAPADGGPLASLKGLAGTEESVATPANNTYERTYHLNSIQDAVTALTPFIDAKAAATKGFDTSRSFTFQPFTPASPLSLGDYNG